MLILGVDPGLNKTGYGIVEVTGKKITFKAKGVIITNSSDKLPYRLNILFTGIREVVELYKPAEAAIEEVFVNVNARSSLLLGHARGALLASLCHSLENNVFEYSTLNIKKNITGYGRSNKVDIKRVISLSLGLRDDSTTDDEADALACAICHSWVTINKIARGMMSYRN